MKTTEDRFWAKVLIIPESTCWLWTASKIPGGYGQFYSNKKSIMAHIYSYELHYGSRKGLQVNHHCDVKICVRPQCLWLGTQKDNMDDKVKKDRHIRGERMWASKLKESQIYEIIKLHKETNKTHEEIASIYNMARVTITNILNGQRWRHLNRSNN